MMTKEDMKKEIERSVIELRMQGKTYKEIAETLKISKPTVTKILKKHGYTKSAGTVKQIDFLLSMFVKHFEIDDIAEVKRKIAEIEQPRIRALITTMRKFTKMQAEYSKYLSQMRYYEKQFNIKLKKIT